ncbi:MAG TPA: HlyC/CorC family transporter [Erysipelotrichaceae bacterium]|nr:HlyC/CorC family transporter [Erysipelotrichaceae bacterium]
MSNNEIIMIFMLILLVLASAMFSSIETAYSSSNRIRLKNYASDNNKKAQQVLEVLDNFDEFLSTVLVGNNIVNITATTIATVLFTGFLGPTKGPTISTVVITLVILTFGEISPKSIAKRMPENLAMSTVGVVRFLILILKPLTIFFKGVKALLNKIIKIKESDSDITDELITMVEEAENEGDLDSHESDLISAAIEFNELEVRDILTPRVDLVAAEVTMNLDEIEEVFRLNSFSRLPIYENSLDNIIGILHEKDFYRLYHTKKGSIKNILQPTVYTSLHVKISSLLRQLQSSKTHLSVVLDEYGGTAGIITLEDIIEELVGDIWDEHDTVKEFYTFVAEDVYLVSCDVELEDMFERFNVDYDDEEHDYVTVSGWVISQFDKIPKIGETFTYENLEVLVTNADERKVHEIKVNVLPKIEEKED